MLVITTKTPTPSLVKTSRYYIKFMLWFELMVQQINGFEM